jgi:hypothetical protein
MAKSKNSAIALICSRADDTTEGESNLGGKLAEGGGGLN